MGRSWTPKPWHVAVAVVLEVLLLLGGVFLSDMSLVFAIGFPLAMIGLTLVPAWRRSQA